MFTVMGQLVIKPQVLVLYRKVPKFSDARNFAVIHLKFKQRQNLKVFCKKYASGIANTEDPDQTAPL